MPIVITSQEAPDAPKLTIGHNFAKIPSNKKKPKQIKNMQALKNTSVLIKISSLAILLAVVLVLLNLLKFTNLFDFSSLVGAFRATLGKGDSIAVTQPAPKPSAFKPMLEPLYVTPARLYTQTASNLVAQIDIPLIQVGVEPTGQLEVPGEWGTGGWYKKSSKPGQKGNIVIAAHYDNNFGGPAAFWELKNLLINDKVYLVDELGKVYTYEVVDIFYIDIQDPDRLKIFDSSNKPELTLITCGGVWMPAQGTYNKRVVVKADLVS